MTRKPHGPKGSLITLLCALLVSTPARADDVLYLARILGKMGIPVTRNEPWFCERSGNLAAFVPSKRRIILCGHNMDSSAAVDEAFRHEAIHLLQHCLGVETIIDPAETRAAATAQDLADMALYPPADRPGELEARAFSRVFTGYQLADWIHRAC